MLIHGGRVMHICTGKLSNYWVRWWLVACSAPSHYLNQCWYIVNWTLRNILKWNIYTFSAGLGSIPIFQFNSNSNSVIFNSNSNSTTPNKFQFQFQFGTFQFQFRRIQIQSQFQEWPVDVFLDIDFDYDNKVHAYKIIFINTISLISLVKWL